MIRDDIRDPAIRILQAPAERGGHGYSDAVIAQKVGIQHVRSWQIRTGF
jgi:hypothetical protein